MSEILNHKIYGTGEPLIILHGLFGMLDNWQSIARKLQENYQVILVDQRNHGKSIHSNNFSYEEMAEDIIALMDHLDIVKASIIGHSMGGKTAIQTANNYPDRVIQLIIVDIVPKQYQRGHDEIFKAIQSVPISKIENRKVAEDFLKLHIGNMGIRQFLLKNLHRNKDGSFEWKANFDVLYREYENIIGPLELKKTIVLPTLFIRGTKSPYISDADLVDMGGIFSNLLSVDIDAGHWVHAERPLELHNAVRAFVKL